jgi:hypothetical protein
MFHNSLDAWASKARSLARHVAGKCPLGRPVAQKLGSWRINRAFQHKNPASVDEGLGNPS